MIRIITSVASLVPLAVARPPVISCWSRQALTTLTRGGATEFETLSAPAPGSPFHYAFPVHDLEAAKTFYGTILGCAEGRSSEKVRLCINFALVIKFARHLQRLSSFARLVKWQDFSLHGHQIVCHWVGNDYRCTDYYNPVDGTYDHS